MQALCKDAFPLRLLSLHTLDLGAISEGEVEFFLRNMICPKLEELALNVETPANTDLKVQSEPNGVDCDLRWPNLRRIRLGMDSSTSAVLGRIPLLPVGATTDLRIVFDQQWDPDSTLDQVKARFKNTISRFHPKYFFLIGAPFRVAWPMLSWMNCHCLQRLHMAFGGRSSEQGEQDSSFLSYQDPQLPMPQLKQLIIYGGGRELNQCLNHLQGVNDLDALDITMDLGMDGNTVYNPDSIKSLIATLVPTKEGELRFPQLKKFDFSATLGISDVRKDGSSIQILNESQKLEAREWVTHLLMARANAGALPLELIRPVGFDGKNELLYVTARAHS